MKVKKNILYFLNILVFLCFTSYIGSFVISAFFTSQKINIILKVILVALIAIIIGACYIIGSAAQEWDVIQDFYESGNHLRIWEIVMVLGMMLFSICISIAFYGASFRISELGSVIFAVFMIPVVYFAGRLVQDFITGALAAIFCMVLPIGAFSGQAGFVFGWGNGFLSSCAEGIAAIHDGGKLSTIVSRMESITVFGSSLPKLIMCLFFFFSIWSGLFLFISKKNGGVFLTVYFNLVIILQALFDFTDYFYLIIYPAAALTSAMGISFFVHKWIFSEDLEEGYDDITESSFEKFQIVNDEEEERKHISSAPEKKEKTPDSQEISKKQETTKEAVPMGNSSKTEPETINETLSPIETEPEALVSALEVQEKKEPAEEIKIKNEIQEEIPVYEEEGIMLEDESRLLDEEEALLFASQEQDNEEAEFFEDLANSAKEAEQLREQVRQAEKELTELTEKYQKQKLQLKDLIQLLEQSKERQQSDTKELAGEKQKVEELEAKLQSLHQDMEKQKQKEEGYHAEAENFRLAAEESRVQAEKLKEEAEAARKEAESVKEESRRYRQEADDFRRQSEQYRQENSMLLGKIEDLREKLEISEQNNSREELERLRAEREQLEADYQNKFTRLQEEKAVLEQKYQEELQKRRELLRRAKEEIGRVRKQISKR